MFQELTLMRSGKESDPLDSFQDHVKGIGEILRPVPMRKKNHRTKQCISNGEGGDSGYLGTTR